MSAIEQELTDRLTEFLATCYHEAVAQLAADYPSTRESIEVDWMDLYRFDADLADDYQRDPDLFAGPFQRALDTVDIPIDRDISGAAVRVRMPQTEVTSIPEAGASDVGEYVGLEGQVTKRTTKQPRPEQVVFECQRCGTTMTVSQNGDQFRPPHECQGCERQGPFQALQGHEDTTFREYQRLRLKQPPEETKGGQGDYIDIHVEDDLVNSVNPGDRAVVMGQFRVELPDGGSDDRAGTKYMEGQAIDVQETDFAEIDTSEYRERVEALATGAEGDPYDLLMEALAPKLRIDPEIKEAIVLQLFGGVAVDYPDGSYDRGDSHILLLGDPGTAKSSLLRAVEAIAPRSSYVSGKGATRAGMTAAAVPDDFSDGKWSLEAGALVLASSGIACVDEIDKVREDALDSLHGALESQRVEVDKADIHATLPAETALLAAGNPEYGRFDPYEPVADQIDLDPPLLSRFDLLFMITDDPDEQADRRVAEHMIESRNDAIRYTETGEATERIDPVVDREVIRAWVAHARQSVTPRWDDPSVRESLVESFTEFRQINADGDGDAPVPVTMRKQEAIERLAEASARVRLSETVEQRDLDRATRLVGKSLKQVGMDPDSDTYDADVIEVDASTSQRQQIKTILSIIEEEQSGSPPSASVDRVVAVASDEAGLNPQKVRDRIDYLATEKGEIARQGDEIWSV